MKIAYNPKDAVVVTATTAANNDILFDLNAKKVWAKGLRMGADWEDISNKPSSLKNPTALTTFGVVYDGSVAKTVTPSNFIGQLQEGTSAVTDGTMFITSVATNNGFSDTGYVNIPYKRKASCLWDYIKTKTDALYSVIEHNHDNRYLKLTGGTMDDGARIGVYGDLFIGDEYNGGWLYLQDIASQDGYDYWRITTDGTAEFEYMTIRNLLTVNNDIWIDGQIRRNAKGNSWNKGRNSALLRETSSGGYHTLWSLKTKDGSWEFGEYNINNDWNNIPLLSYITDTDFNNGNNAATYQIKFPLASGTVALTSQVSSFDVNTAQYLRSLGNQDCQTGRTQNYGNVYSYNTIYGNTGAPTDYTSVIGFGRGTAGTVEIAGGWCNSHLYWRSLRDCCDDWYSWRVVLDSSNYTEFVNNYYWANVKISTTSSTNTSPTVNTLTATRVCAGHDPGIDNSISCSGWFRSSGDTGWYNTTYRGGWYMSDTDWIRAHNNVGIYTGGQIYSSNSIRMGDIYLQNGNEINNTNSNLYINYRGTRNINMCHGGGSVIIGPQIDNVNNNKLYVNGAATIVGSTTLNSTATFNGLVYNNGGILPATCDFNNTGAGYSVWGDAMSTGVTAITDALDPTYVSVFYSQDNGTTWIGYALSDQDKFSLYANNGSSISIFLGNNETSSLAQVQKNQSIVTFEIPNGLYSALCWASVDIGQGIKTVCTVEIISKNGTITKTFTKTMIGWNKFNYINFWGIDNSITDIGSDQVRFVRFKFKHDTSNTNIRNAQIRKIRLFSFTKFYLDPSDFRSVMGNTGHLYKYDKNLNVTFPNIINCKTLDITNAIRVGNNLSIYSESGTKKLAQLDQSDILSIYTKIYLSKGLCVGLQGPTFAGNVTTDDASAFIGTVPSGSFIFTFKPALNGQLLFFKLLKSSHTTKFMCATENCKVVRSSDFSISININNAAEVFGDGRSRIFIYQSAYARWLEFYCG